MKFVKFACILSALALTAACSRESAAKPESGKTEIKTAAELKPGAKGEIKMTVKKGDKIKVQYEGSTTADGKVFDKSKPESPLGFTVGAGQMIKGFDKAVEGMKLNEEKTVSFKCEEGYGKRDEKMLMKFKKDFFPKDVKVEKGMMVPLQDQSGNVHQAVVVEVNAEGAVLDLNHFLAGKDLTFKIKIVSIE
ncbi:MAG: peptidylprolyl isomerase [Candidatus Firestonebacteria bacterium]